MHKKDEFVQPIVYSQMLLCPSFKKREHIFPIDEVTITIVKRTSNSKFFSFDMWALNLQATILRKIHAIVYLLCTYMYWISSFLNNVLHFLFKVCYHDTLVYCFQDFELSSRKFYSSFTTFSGYVCSYYFIWFFFPSFNRAMIRDPHQYGLSPELKGLRAS